MTAPFPTQNTPYFNFADNKTPYFSFRITSNVQISADPQLLRVSYTAHDTHQVAKSAPLTREQTFYLPFSCKNVTVAVADSLGNYKLENSKYLTVAQGTSGETTLRIQLGESAKGEFQTEFSTFVTGGDYNCSDRLVGRFTYLPIFA